MNRIKHLKEQRGAKLKELEALQKSAEKRSYTKEEGEKFDALEAEIRSFNSDIEREERAAGLASAHKPVEERAIQERATLGLTDEQVRSYSLVRAINQIASGKKLDGFEGELHQEEQKRSGRDTAGFFVPSDIFTTRDRRAMTVGSASGGGHLVGVDIDQANMVALLRNQSHLLGLGARVITGLKNDVSIPRVLTGATAYWVSETGTITSSNATFGQIQMKPRRLGASVPYSSQFLAQSGLGVDMFVRDDIMAAFGIELDRVGINGAGGSEPLGILNLASGDRATGVTFGAAATWAKVVEFETAVATANALGLPGGEYAYLTTPATKGKWKTAPKVANTAVFLWEGELVNGYAARATNQVPSDKVIYGQPGQLIYGEWMGTEMIVDPYTLATSGQVKVTVQKLVDMVVRQTKAFSVSADSGAQ